MMTSKNMMANKKLSTLVIAFIIGTLMLLSCDGSEERPFPQTSGSLEQTTWYVIIKEYDKSGSKVVSEMGYGFTFTTRNDGFYRSYGTEDQVLYRYNHEFFYELQPEDKIIVFRNLLSYDDVLRDFVIMKASKNRMILENYLTNKTTLEMTRM